MPPTRFGRVPPLARPLSRICSMTCPTCPACRPHGQSTQDLCPQRVSLAREVPGHQPDFRIDWRIGISNARPVQGCPPPVARNRPYVASKLRGRVAGLGYLGHQQASAQSLWPVPGHPASEPRRPHGAHAGLRWSLGQAGPYRLAHRSMKSGLILEFTAGWTAQAAPAPQAAARSDTAPAQHAPGATGSSQ